MSGTYLARPKSVEEKAAYLVNTSVEDMRSSLDFIRDLAVLERALDLVTTTGEKTKQLMLERRIRKMKKRVAEKQAEKESLP